MSWLGEAARLQSRGSTTAKAETLGGLHARRRLTGAQYFTGRWIGEGIWSVLQSAIDGAPKGRTLSVIDTSIGSGRLLEHADTDACSLYGIDIDERCVAALSEDGQAAGISYTFEAGRMEDLSINQFDIGVINPPFSITLQSPLMEAYPCTCFGRYGPNTSALSHEYALAQALDGAAVVAALLPISMEAECHKEPRLAGIYRLPTDAFKAENAAVATAVFIFDSSPRDGAIVDATVQEGDVWPALALTIEKWARARFSLGGIDQSAPSITLPVTGNRRVRLEHHNRRVILKFDCGLVQAKVLNGILDGDVRPSEGHRYPRGVKFRGDARLWMDTWLLQEHPQGAFDKILNTIRAYGGIPVVSSSLAGFWERLKRRHVRAMTPFRHWIKRSGGNEIQATAIRSCLLREGDISGPVIKKGEAVNVEPLGGEFRVEKDGESVVLGRSQFEKRFKLDETELSGESEWVLIEKGLEEAFPDLAKQARARMAAAGIDWLWPFQSSGTAEHLINPYGAVAAWKQGLGKARMSIALALLSGKHSAVVVESNLVDEMVTEIRDKLKLDEDLWRVIDRNDEIKDIDLRQVNIVSYNTLKKRVRGRVTIAKLLRRRFHTVIADEGGLLANLASQQSRALLALAARKLIVSDGTPIASYPRDLYSVVGATAGSAVAHQPYGLRHGAFVEQRLFTSASYAMRGVDQFRDKHIVLEWSTNQFNENNSQGAKREVPRIANVVDFRKWVQPNVQRKVRYEPEVEPYAGCPKPIYRITEVQWDKDHLRHYLDVALNFANWYVAHLSERAASGKGTNLIMVLARIGAVMAAANQPHKERKHSLGLYMPLTSKQRVALDRIEENVREGKKTILYAYSPSVIERLADELQKRGIPSVKFHGGISIEKRTEALNKEFRYGDTQVLLSSWVGQKGLNLPQAKRLIIYDRNWAGTVEDQAVHRTQRPDQDERVIVDRLHIEGSIDEYVAQVVDWKEAAADSGLDWGDGITETDVFRHLDSVIEEFCRATLDLSARDALKVLAA